mgnify:FL=1
MTISLRLNPKDEKLIKTYASMKHMSVSEVVRRAVIEQIEDEFDIREYFEAKAEFDRYPVTFTLEEVEKELGFR